MAKLHFPGPDVLRLIQEAEAAAKHIPTFMQSELEKLTPETTPPALHWVKDEGIYLISNADMELPPSKREGAVVYAEGFKPTPGDFGWYDLARAAVGGDDFGEVILTTDLDERDRRDLAIPGSYFLINVTPKQFSIGVLVPKQPS